MYQTLYQGNGVDIFVNGPAFQWKMSWVPALADKLTIVCELVEPEFLIVQDEFLPPDWTPYGQNGNGRRTGTSRGNPRPIRFDFSRFDFLYRVHPYVRVGTFAAFETQKAYIAFLVRAASGKAVALVDTSEEDNALYVFRADLNWGQVATRRKPEVRSGRYPEFVRRVFHQGDWQGRVTQLLATL